MTGESAAGVVAPADVEVPGAFQVMRRDCPVCSVTRRFRGKSGGSGNISVIKTVASVNQTLHFVPTNLGLEVESKLNPARKRLRQCTGNLPYLGVQLRRWSARKGFLR